MRTYALLILSSLAVGNATEKGKRVKLVKAKPSKKGFAALPIQQTPVELECPEGYIMDQSQCIRALSAELQPFCMRGVLAGDVCEIASRPTPTCGQGFMLAGGVCTRTTFDDLNITCPPGYELGAGRHTAHCTREVAMPPLAVCPAGTFGNECITYEYTEPTYTCAQGAEMNGHECITTRVYECAPAGQGKGHSKGHGKAYDHGHAKLRWLKGITFGKGKGHEHQEKGHDKHEKGHTYVAMPSVTTEVISQQCQETVSTPATRLCVEGAELIGDSCRTAITAEKIEQAVPPAIETVPATAGCAADFTPCGGHKKRGGQCCRVEQEAPELICPSGSDMRGAECVFTAEVEYRCQSGYARQGDECIMHEIVPPTGTYTITYQCEGYGCGIEREAAKYVTAGHKTPIYGFGYGKDYYHH